LKKLQPETQTAKLNFNIHVPIATKLKAGLNYHEYQAYDYLYLNNEIQKGI
jgi:hypothetical protein